MAGFFSDNFNRADENLEASADWTRQTGSAGGIVVSGNQLVNADTTSGGSVYTAPDIEDIDHFVEFTVRNISADTGPFALVRVSDDGGDWLGVRVGRVTGTNGSLEVYVRVSGSLGERHTTTSQNVQIGDTIRLIAEGGNYTVLHNGATVVSEAIANSALNDNTHTGLISRVIAHNPWIDNFSAGPLGLPPIAVTGLLGTSNVGSVSVGTAFSASVSATGVSATGSVGSESVELDYVVSPTGVSGTANTGTVTVTTVRNVEALLTGVEATGTAGSVIFIFNVEAEVQGVEAEGEIGDIGFLANLTVAVTGFRMTSSLGDAGTAYGYAVPVLGNEAIGSSGVVTPYFWNKVSSPSEPAWQRVAT